MSLYGNKVTKTGVWLSRDQVRRWESKVEGSVYGWSKPCDESEDYVGTVSPNLGMTYNRKLRDVKRGNAGLAKSLECEKDESYEYTLLPSNAISRNATNTSLLVKKGVIPQVKQDYWDMFGGLTYGRY
jgi:hypothetical protein